MLKWRIKRLQVALIAVALTLLWLCIRFPFEMLNFAEKLVGTTDQVDPLTLHLRGEFVESNLGTAVESDGSVTVRLIAQQYNFVPNCVQVPQSHPVRFRITSADVVHRFSIAGTDYALEAVPGHVSQSQFQFGAAGEYPTPCREFCGAGHYAMRSRIRVLAEDQFPKLKPEERLSCDSH